MKRELWYIYINEQQNYEREVNYMNSTPEMENSHSVKNKFVAIEQFKTDQEVKDKLSSWDKDELVEYLLCLRKNRAFRREDRLKLQILDQVDFTIWACDSKFEIKLWEGTCEKIYQKKREDALGQNYLKLFVTPIERYQSKIDCEKIIKTGEPQPFRLCDDEDGRGFPVQIITQCCRIRDDDGQPLQAEMALNVNYEKLKRESQIFVDARNRENNEIEQTRMEMLSSLESCRLRLIESADRRSSYFINIKASQTGTYTYALDAMKKIIAIRREFTEYYQRIKAKIQTVDCDCDYGANVDDDNHSFNCCFRTNRKKLIMLQEEFEKKEVEYQLKLASVELDWAGESN